MNNRLLQKAFLSGAAVNPYRIVKFGADSSHVIQAAAATDALLGVTNELSAAAAEGNLDITLAGIAEIELGGTVALTDKLTSDSVGRAVAAAPAAGSNVQIVGHPLKTGVSGDIIPVRLSFFTLQG